MSTSEFPTSALPNAPAPAETAVEGILAKTHAAAEGVLDFRDIERRETGFFSALPGVGRVLDWFGPGTPKDQVFYYAEMINVMNTRREQIVEKAKAQAANDEHFHASVPGVAANDPEFTKTPLKNAA